MLSTSAPAWQQSLKKALNHGGTQRAKRDRSEAKRKQVQVASVDADGRPHVRTMVFRGFLPAQTLSGEQLRGDESSESLVPTPADTWLPMLITDTRSAKYAQLSGGPAYVELCYWLDEAGVQFRISGRAVLAGPNCDDPNLRAARAAVWDRLGDGSRRTFAWPEPGAPRDESGADGATNGGPCGLLAESHFALAVVVPDRVDELRLGGSQKRFRHELVPRAVDLDATVDVAAERAGERGQTARTTPSGCLPDSLDLMGVWVVQEVNP